MQLINSTIRSLHVIISSVKPYVWTNGSTLISITEGHALSITCYQSSNPPSSGPKWWKLNGMGKMDLFANDSGLYVILVTRRDSGIYICEALNTIGTGSTNITINVLCKFYLLYAFVIFIIDINSQTCIPNIIQNDTDH